MVSRKTKSRIAKVIAVLFLGAAIAACVAVWWFWHNANPSPCPNGVSGSVSEVKDEESEYPVVDWDYWLSVNPDIVAWITVPGTQINHPVVQAHSDNPDYYLKHDIYRNYNPMGCLYLDADCETEGIATRNAVILGHHWNDPANMGCFTVIANYNDKVYASEHATLLVQTPNLQMKYQVRFADVVPGWKPTKRTTFKSNKDFKQWYEGSLDTAEMVLDGDTRPNQTISLVSCSYNYWAWNERTVVITSNVLGPEMETDGLSTAKSEQNSLVGNSEEAAVESQN